MESWTPFAVTIPPLPHDVVKPELSIYSLLTVVAIGLSLTIWLRLFKKDRRLVTIYFGALFGAVIGAKLVYLFAEGWMAWGSPTEWQQWMTGKSIVGALLGGYLGVELGKKIEDYTEPTGDYFALIVPAGIALGRVGCLLQGCCLGRACAPAWWTLRDAHDISRWPAVPVEILFNLLALGAILILRKRKLFPGQLFHLYLMAYGIFRFFHEPFRATPDIWHGITGYQIAALLVALLGLGGFLHRRRIEAN